MEWRALALAVGIGALGGGANGAEGQAPPRAPAMKDAQLSAEFDVSGPEREADGVLVYRVRSPFQADEVLVRILLPERRDPAAAPRVVFVLPVERRLGTRFGDGLRTVQALGLHNRYGLIVVAPTFSDWPWYVDHPTNPGLRQESHLVWVVVPLIERLYPHGPRRRALLGFSKSGWGAFCVLLRHPEVFWAAAAWDPPLMLERPIFELGPIVGTQENLGRYHVPRLLAERADTVRPSKRLALFGHNLFRDHAQQAHALLEKLGIPHDYADGPLRPHRWDSGWIESAVESLHEMLGD